MNNKMKIKIEDGKTIISTGIGSDSVRNKTGVVGLSFRKDYGYYSLASVYEGKKYHIGNYDTIEEGKAMRKKADEHIKDGTFVEWVKQFKRTKNSYGVKGLFLKGKSYQLVISVKKKKYFLGSFNTVEEAKVIREEAEKQVKAGTFEQWISERKSNKNI